MTQTVRTARFAVLLVLASASSTLAQGSGSRGTMGVPRLVTSPPSTTTRPAPPPPSGRGVMTVPRYDSPTGPRGGDVPRVVTHQGSGYVRGRRVGSGYGSGSGYTTGSSVNRGSGYSSGTSMSGSFGHRFDPGSSHRWRPGYTRWGVGAGCSIGCFRIGVGGRSARFFGSFVVGYPFAVPVVVPYFYSSTFERYDDQPIVESYVPEPEPGRAASKLIVIGGSGSGGDALTVETIGDSVRLNWLGAGRPAREVKLFVADSTQRQLATRSASAAAPTATFEVATLSAPVAFAGVTVTFTDGVTTTTMVPYRSSQTR